MVHMRPIVCASVRVLLLSRHWYCSSPCAGESALRAMSRFFLWRKEPERSRSADTNHNFATVSHLSFSALQLITTLSSATRTHTSTHAFNCREGDDFPIIPLLRYDVHAYRGAPSRDYEKMAKWFHHGIEKRRVQSRGRRCQRRAQQGHAADVVDEDTAGGVGSDADMRLKR
jgi:hypothetical protein